MKKFIILSFFALLFLTSITFSQIHIGLGGEVGIDIANGSSNIANFSPSSRTGFLIGGNCELRFGNYFAVQPGVRYVMKGWSNSGTDANGQTFTTTDALNYLEVPILLKAMYPIPQTQIRPYALFGPLMSFNMSANETTTTPNATQSTDVSANVSGFDFGLLFGAGFGYDITHKIDIFVQFAYNLGISNLLKNAGNNSIKNTGILIDRRRVNFGL